MNKFLAGVTLGVIAGLLLAPERGKDTRENIADAAEKWKEKWDRLIGRTGMEVADLKEILASEIVGLKDDVRSRIRTILDESADSASRMQKEFTV